ncbi:MAG: hypothetical protein R3C49_26235 [Planctomycetaceae bacterium]
MRWQCDGNVSISLILNDLEASACDAEDNAEEGDQPSNGLALTNRGAGAARRLGVTINERARRIGAGSGQSLRRLSPVHFRLLLLFLNSDDDQIRTEDIVNSWRRINPRRVDPISADSVRTQISQLNTNLHGTGIEVLSIGGGYQLQHIGS